MLHILCQNNFASRALSELWILHVYSHITRPNQKIDVFTVTCLEKHGPVGQDDFFFFFMFFFSNSNAHFGIDFVFIKKNESLDY